MCVRAALPSTTGRMRGAREAIEKSSVRVGERKQKSMRIFPILALAFRLAVLTAHAQSIEAGRPALPDRSYKLLRADEDWSFLRDTALRKEFWELIKYVRLRGGADDWFMTIGGEAREVWEQIGNDSWGQQPYMNGYLNERYMLYFDVHYGKHVRTFVGLKSGLNSFRSGGRRPFDEKKLDFQAAFLELGTTIKDSPVKLLVGRQELEYGSGRLIDAREGPNVRMSFTGFRLQTFTHSWQIDGFAMRP